MVYNTIKEGKDNIMANAKLLVPFIKRWEGGYVNDPADLGGETNMGITIGTWKSCGYDCSEKIAVCKVGNKTYSNVTKSLYEMTEDQWFDVFKTKYWDRWQADKITDQKVANWLVDWVWASGNWGIKKPQELLGVKADGVVGPITLAAVNAQNPAEFAKRLHAARIKFVEDIVANNPTQARFINGWKNRINALV